MLEYAQIKRYLNMLEFSIYQIKDIAQDTLSQYPGGDGLTHREKFQILKNFPGWDLAVNFSPGR